jgi:hypothetical protein
MLNQFYQNYMHFAWLVYMVFWVIVGSAHETEIKAR